MKTSYGFSRRGPDHVAEEIAKVLSIKTAHEFKALFLIVFANLKALNRVSGGEEMLRLRAYEKLHALVQAGVVKKTGKEYSGVPAALVAFLNTAAELNSQYAARVLKRQQESDPKASPSVTNGAKIRMI